MTKKLSDGAEHKLPSDLKKALNSSNKTIDLWESLTPLGRTEFIAWVEDAKKEETRKKRIKRACEELIEGKRRPCCWPGFKNKDKYKRS